MAKLKTRYVCQECGADYPRWAGKCDACGAWNSIVEEAPVASVTRLGATKGHAAETVSLQAHLPEEPRWHTGSEELDRVLGGGMVRGSAILIGGDPGIGKSTLLLQSSAFVGKTVPVLYVSGEESAQQIQMRAKRLGLADTPMKLATTGQIEAILATIAQEKPGLVILDSIQTLFSEKSESAPGTVSQVRLAAHELIQVAKRTNTTIIFVGHVTKEGQIAGPRVLEHMVDTVLYFEGERGHTFRILRAFKNRFGATNEIGVFEMQSEGLRDVTNPSALFLSERPEGAAGSAVLAALEGTRPVLMEVQALVSQSQLAQPRRTTLGVDGNRVAMIAAVLEKHCGFPFGRHDIFLNITGGLKVTEPGADLAIAAALVSSLLERPIDPHTVILGEVGLAGEVRTVSQLDMRVKEAAKLGFTKALTPPAGKTIPKGMRVSSLKRLDELTAGLFD
ncbi:MAG: DNA repair protein RadA [Proteobacteria bacterium]|nr:DNA repair protein RadA [Pseudomonadota bacterium]